MGCVLAPVAARATVPGHWDPVTAPTGANIDQVGLLRDASGSVHVVWHQEPQGSSVGTALIRIRPRFGLTRATDSSSRSSSRTPAAPSRMRQ
jgi:hypothetical protein